MTETHLGGALLGSLRPPQILLRLVCSAQCHTQGQPLLLSHTGCKLRTSEGKSPHHPAAVSFPVMWHFPVTKGLLCIFRNSFTCELPVAVVNLFLKSVLPKEGAGRCFRKGLWISYCGGWAGRLSVAEKDPLEPSSAPFAAWKQRGPSELHGRAGIV